MSKLFAALALSCVSLVVAGCMAETDPGDGELESVEGEEAGEENVGEASLAIEYGAWNGSCAQSLTLRDAPNGGYKCGYQMSYGTALYADHSNGGSWAYVYVGSGPCNSMWGWVLKDYVSRNCLL